MKAVILAGGRGTRLMPLTKNLPKPMIEIEGKPILQYQIELLKKNDIKEIILCGQYRIEKIKNYFRDGKKFGVSIKYPEEREPFGTGGAIKNAEKFIDDDFVLLYGDTFIDMDLKKLIKFHEEKKSVVTLTLHETDHPEDSDLIKIDDNGMVIQFFNRPNKKPYPSKFSKSSVYACKISVINEIKPGAGNFENDILPILIKKGVVYGYVTNEFLKDMGTFDRLEKVKKYLQSKKRR